MKRNGRHRNGTHAKHRRARITRKLQHIAERREAELRSLLAFLKDAPIIEQHAFAGWYQPMTHVDAGTPSPAERAYAGMLAELPDPMAGAVAYYGTLERGGTRREASAASDAALRWPVSASAGEVARLELAGQVAIASDDLAKARARRDLVSDINHALGVMQTCSEPEPDASDDLTHTPEGQG